MQNDKIIDFKVQKYSRHMTIQHQFDPLILFLKLLWDGYCLMGNTNMCCPIHGIAIGMTFLWTSLCLWYMHQITIALRLRGFTF